MIKENVASILSSIPNGILLVAAAKKRMPDEVTQAIEAGISILGYNYVQEAEQMHSVVSNAVRWHLIGHLQNNKAKRAVQLFDMIETIDSWKIAQKVDRHCS